MSSLGLSACGDDEQRAETDRACPEGTPSLEARDVIGTTPNGYQVVEGDPVALGQVADSMKKTMGPAYRDWIRNIHDFFKPPKGGNKQGEAQRRAAGWRCAQAITDAGFR